MSPAKGSYTVNRSTRSNNDDTDSDESSRRLTSSPGHPERPDSSATDDQNVNRQEASDEASSGTDSLDHHTNDVVDVDEGDASSDFIPKKLAQGSDSSVDGGMSLTKNELMIRKAYLFLRLTLGTLNLTSFILKVPLLLLILRIAVELSQQKKREAAVTTIEPPYDDEIPLPSKESGTSDKRAIVAEALVLLVLYVSLLLVHILCVFAFWLNKGVFHLFLHLPLVSIWLFLAITSYFVTEWRWALKIIFFVFQALVHGNDIINPTRTESLLLRISIWFDLVTVLLSIIFVFAFFKLKKQLKTAKISCKPHYNILQCL